MPHRPNLQSVKQLVVLCCVLARADIYGIACGVVAGRCFGVYTVSAKRLIRSNVNMLAACRSRCSSAEPPSPRGRRPA
jgi:drug/metabolite transporter (DMT)-like permease